MPASINASRTTRAKRFNAASENGPLIATLPTDSNPSKSETVGGSLSFGKFSTPATACSTSE